MNILLENANIVHVDNQKSGVYKSDIYIEDSFIKKIDTLLSRKIREKFDKQIDLKGKFVIPGFVQSHVHLCQTAFRGMAEDMELLDWLSKKIWPFEAGHDESSIYDSAMIGLKELIEGGTTTITDMATANHTDGVFEAAKESGIRAFIGNALMDCGANLPKGLLDSTEEAISKSKDLIDKYHGSEKGRLNYILSPRFILSCSDELFEEARKLSEENNLLIQTHACENPDETKTVIKMKGKNEIKYFEESGILSENTILAHCVWLDTEDMELISRRNAKIAHCPTTNLKLGSGIAKVPEMIEEGIIIGLGSDGAPCNNNLNMWGEMKLSGLLQKYRKGVKALPAKKILQMATIDGAKLLHMDHLIGSIDEGKKADLVILDLERSNTLPAIEDIYTRIVYSADQTNIVHTLIDGEFRYTK